MKSFELSVSDSEKKAVVWIFPIALISVLFFLWLSSDDDKGNNTPKISKREQRIDNCFSTWDGSHKTITQYIKLRLNNPDSYEHVKTVYLDQKKFLKIKTIFRAQNGFGATITKTIWAKVDLDGNILSVNW